MEKKKKFNIVYNKDKSIGFGEGYYVIFESSDGHVYMDTYYKTWEVNEQVDGVSVGIINRLKYLCELGYVYDNWFSVDLKTIF